MNSKNLSKAINRMLAILLTAAMVAGSFTVPVKATEGEPAVESMTDDAADASDDVAEDVTEDKTSGETQAEPEAVTEESDESENAVGSSLDAPEITEEGELETNDGAAVEMEIKMDTDELAELNKTYDAAPVTEAAIKSHFKVCKKGTSEQIPTETNKLRFVYYKQTAAGWAIIADATPVINATSLAYDDDTTIKNAGTYRVDASYFDGGVSLEEKSYTFTISKVNINDWVWDLSHDGTVSATTTFKYSVIDKPGRPANSSEKVAKELGASDASTFAFTLAPPTSSDAVHSEFAGLTLNSTNINLEFTKGTGRNTLYNATIAETNAEKPHVTATIKDDANLNFEGSFTVPFVIGAKAASGNDADGPSAVEAPDLTEELNVPDTDGVEVTLNLDQMVKDEIQNEEGTKAFITKELKDVVLSASLTDDDYSKVLNKFFVTEKIIKDVDGTDTIVEIPKVDIKIDHEKGIYTLKIKTKKDSEIASPYKEAELKLDFSFNNYAGVTTVTIPFVTTQDSGVGIKSGTVDNPVAFPENYGVSYIGELAAFDIIVEDSNVDFSTTGANTTISTYWYVGQGDNKQFMKKGDEIAFSGKESESVNGKGLFTLTAPEIQTGTPAAPDETTFIEPGKYSVLVVYKDNGANAGSAKKTINFEIKPDTTAHVFYFVGQNDSLTVRNYATNGSLPLDPSGTTFSAADVKVFLDSGSGVELKEGVDYEITYPNEAAIKAVWSKTAKAAELVDKYKNSEHPITETGVDNQLNAVRNDINGYYPGELAKDGDTDVTAVNKASSELKIAVFANEPYAKISLKGGETNKHFTNIPAIYVRYEITDSVATLNPDFTVAHTPDVGTVYTSQTIDLKGALVLGGTVKDPIKYTVTKSGTNNAKVISFMEEVTVADEMFTFSTDSDSPLAAGDTFTFTFTPDFGDEKVTADPVVITYTCKGQVVLKADVASTAFKNGKFEYTGSAVLTGGNGTYNTTSKIGEVGTSFTYKVEKNGTDVTGTGGHTVTTTIYRLADETNNPTATDDATGTGADGGTNRYEYPKDSGVFWTKTYFSAATTLSPITAENVGRYIAVTKLTTASYTADDVVIPFEITKKNYSDANAKIVQYYNGTKPVYKDVADSSYDKLKKKTAVITEIINAAGDITALDGTTALSPAIDLASYEVTEIGDMVKKAVTTGSTTTYKYVFPVTLSAKADDPDAETPYYNNFSGTITGEVEVSEASLTNTDFRIILNDAVYKYNGEVQLPTIKYISYKGKEFKGTEASILSQLKAEIDPNYFEAELVWPGSDNYTTGYTDDGKSVTTHKLELKIGGLYKYATPSSAVYSNTYSIGTGDNDDMKDVNETNTIEFILPTSATADTAIKLGSLPTEFESNTDGKDAYKIASYDVTGLTAVAPKNAAGEAKTSDKIVVAVNATTGLVTVTPESTASYTGKEGWTYEFDVPATVTNYAAKNIKVKITVKDADLNTSVIDVPTTTGSPAVATGFVTSDAGGADYNTKNAIERLADLGTDTLKIKQGGKTFTYAEAIAGVNAAGDTFDGTLNIEWYKSDTYATAGTATVASTYTKCKSVDETANAGYYQALITLDGGSRYYMTPAWTKVLRINAKTLANTDRVGSIIVDDSKLFYNGKDQYPDVTINVKADAFYTGSPAQALKQGDATTKADFMVKAETAGARTAAGSYTIATANGLTGRNVTGTVLQPESEISWSIAKSPIKLNLKDKVYPVDSTGATAPTFADLFDAETVEGLAEGEELDITKFTLRAKDASGAPVNVATMCKTAGTYEVSVNNAFAASSIKKTTGGTATQMNYELDSNSRKATITVEPPKTITPTYTVKVGDQELTKKDGEIVFFDNNIRTVEVTLKDDTTEIDPENYVVTVADKDGGNVVKAEGDYTVTIKADSDLYDFTDIVVTFKVEKEAIDAVPAVKVGTTNIKKDGQTVVYTPDTPLALTVDLMNGEKSVSKDDYTVKITKDGTELETVPATLTAENAEYVITYTIKDTALIKFSDTAKTSVSFKVADKPARQVTKISFDSTNLKVKYNDPKMGTTDAMLLVDFDIEGEEITAADIDYSTKLVGSKIVVTPKDGGIISFTSTGYGDGSANDTIEYTFWVDGDETKTATIRVRNMPESTSGEADPGTPVEEPSEYEKPGEKEARELIDINEAIASATAPKTAPKYTGKPVEPKITVKAKTGYKLVAGTDYKVTYANNINAVTANAADEEGAIAIVSGIGQYTGSFPVYFSIDRKKLGGTIVAGTIVTPEKDDDVADMIAGAISVYDGKLILGYDGDGDADYTITPDAAANKGKYGFTVNYTGNYTGSKKGTVRLAAGAYDIGIADVTVTFGEGEEEADTAIYTGKAITTKTGMNIKVVMGEETELTEKTHYTVSYKNNVNAGLGTITLKGKKPYSGTKVVTFPIAADEESELKVEVKSGSKYTGKLLKPAVTVTANGKRLKKGTDYLLYYSAELNAGTKAGKVIVRPIGNYWYEGVEDVKQWFDIEKADFKKTSIKKDSSTKRSGIYFNGKKLVADEDFIAAAPVVDSKGKYTVTITVAEDSTNFIGGAIKTIKGTKDQIDWAQLGFEVDDKENPIF